MSNTVFKQNHNWPFIFTNWTSIKTAIGILSIIIGTGSLDQNRMTEQIKMKGPKNMTKGPKIEKTDDRIIIYLDFIDKSSITFETVLFIFWPYIYFFVFSVF